MRIVWILLVVGVTACGVLQAAEPVDVRRPSAVATTHVPAVDGAFWERLRQYQNTRSAAFRGWAPDGTGMLIATRFGNTAQLHRVYFPGGAREQVTFFDEPASGRFLPEAQDGALLLSIASGGNENGQLFLFDRGTGRATLLTDGKSRNLGGPIRHDGKRLVFGSNRRNGKDTDLYIGNPRDPQSFELLMEVNDEVWSATDWSPDGEWLLMIRYVSINETYPALFHIGTRKRTPIAVPGGVAGAVSSLRFSHDGKSIFAASDVAGEFRQLARIDRATLEWKWLSKQIPWDVDDIEVDHKSGFVAFTVNEDGGSSLYLLEGETARRVDVPLGLIGSLEFSPDGKQLGFTLAPPNGSADAYSLKLADLSLTRWTFSELGGLDPKSFIKPTLIRYKSFDERQIPAYVFKAPSATNGKKSPVLVQIHGGPESQYRPAFSGVEQFYLRELGITVIHPNVRGSDGYGKSYLRLDNAEKREDSVRDIGALLDWIASQPELDAERVAVMGGSYGGYMTLASLVHFGPRLRAGVDIVGISNFETFLKNTSAYRRDLRRAEYGDERDPKMQAVFQKINPANHAEKIVSALLVAHGKNDPRVPFSEAEQIVAKVTAQGRPVWTVFADNEGHGFEKKANRDYLTAVIAKFLSEKLR